MLRVAFLFVVLYTMISWSNRQHMAAWAGDVVSYLCKNKANVGVAAVDRGVARLVTMEVPCTYNIINIQIFINKIIG